MGQYPSSGLSGITVGAVVPFRPEGYQARRNNSGDDTTPFANCVAAAQASALANSGYAVVQLTSGIYLVSGGFTQGGATKGNAQIPVPPAPDTGQKSIVVLKGTDEQAVQPHWNQTVPQLAGAVIRSTASGTADATFGRASVIGGPTPEQGYGGVTNVWSNTMIVIDGVQITVPDNPAVCGFDFRGMAEMNFKNGSVLTNATVPSHTTPTNTWQFGLATPENNNNANSKVGKFVSFGNNYGMYANEHCEVEHFTGLYGVAGIEFGSSGLSTGHGIHVGKVLIEACQVGLGVVDGIYPVKIRVDEFDWENITFALINDPNSYLKGDVFNISGIGVSDKMVDNPSGGLIGPRGATNLNMYDNSLQTGVQGSPPAPPVSGVATRTPYFRDCFFRVNGGTVSNVTVTDSGGTAKSVASSTNTGWIPCPTGAYYAVTYTVVPTSIDWMVT